MFSCKKKKKDLMSAILKSIFQKEAVTIGTTLS